MGRMGHGSIHVDPLPTTQYLINPVSHGETYTAIDFFAGDMPLNKKMKVSPFDLF